MPDIKLNLVNQALTATGNEAISSLSGTDILTIAVAEHYDSIVAEELETSGAYFAMKTAAPTLLTAQLAAPLRYQWQMQSDLLTLRAVLYLGLELQGDKFEIAGRIVRLAWNTDVTLRYIWQVPEELWPTRFRRIIEQRLEALFLRATDRFSEAEARDQSTEIRTIKGRYAEAGQRMSRKMHPGTLVNARRGYGGTTK